LPERWWRTRADPFEHAWCVVEGWLEHAPTATAKELMERLSIMLPEAYPPKHSCERCNAVSKPGGPKKPRTCS